jgi:hypothetical protein
MLLNLGNKQIDTISGMPINEPGITEEQLDEVNKLKKKFKDVIQGKKRIGKYG